MSTYKLYGGDITLVAEKRGKKGGYWIGDRNITRVTSVGVPGPIPPLIFYGAGLAKSRFLLLSETSEFCDALAQYEHSGLKEDFKEVEKYGELIRKAAGDTTLRDRGTEGHRRIQEYIETGEYSEAKPFDGLGSMIRHWLEWWDDNEIEVHGVEKKVYSKEFDYAGTLDLDATVNGMRSIVDWKFGKIRPKSVRTQLAAYAHARTEELDILYDQRMVVSITEDGVKTEIYEDQEWVKILYNGKTYKVCEDFGAFIDLLRFDRTTAKW